NKQQQQPQTKRAAKSSIQIYKEKKISSPNVKQQQQVSTSCDAVDMYEDEESVLINDADMSGSNLLYDENSEHSKGSSVDEEATSTSTAAAAMKRNRARLNSNDSLRAEFEQSEFVN